MSDGHTERYEKFVDHVMETVDGRPSHPDGTRAVLMQPRKDACFVQWCERERDWIGPNGRIGDEAHRTGCIVTLDEVRTAGRVMQALRFYATACGTARSPEDAEGGDVDHARSCEAWNEDFGDRAREVLRDEAMRPCSVERLLTAVAPLVMACHDEFESKVTEHCRDDESVMSSSHDVDSPITFGMIRAARLVLAEMGVE